MRIDNARTKITRQERVRIRYAPVVLKSHVQCGDVESYFVYCSSLERLFAI